MVLWVLFKLYIKYNFGGFKNRLYTFYSNKKSIIFYFRKKACFNFLFVTFMLYFYYVPFLFQKHFRNSPYPFSIFYDFSLHQPHYPSQCPHWDYLYHFLHYFPIRCFYVYVISLISWIYCKYNKFEIIKIMLHCHHVLRNIFL